jgi:hypothetical protein
LGRKSPTPSRSSSEDTPKQQIPGFSEVVEKPVARFVSAAGHKNAVELSAIVHHPVQIIPIEVKRKGSDKELAVLLIQL